MITSTQLLSRLENADSVRDFGAKAVNLARLHRLGYRVPAGIVVADIAFQRHLRDARLNKNYRELLSGLPTMPPNEIGRRSATIRSAILGTPLAPRLRDSLVRVHATLGQENVLAVRSSAASEDGLCASFAGQLDSVLGVECSEQLEDALRQVWASHFSERCLLYARHHGLAEVRMGVIVQRQVQARYSGVLFTRDAVTLRAQALIEYVSGLGDRLVAGAVTPARVRVRYSDMAVIHEAGDGASETAGLSEMTIRELASIGLELERQFGAAQDVEWSVDADGEIVLLQTRPITAAGSTHMAVWSNANIAENFPDVVSPFLYSIVARGYTAYFRNLGLGFGISRWRLQAMSEALENIVGLHAGRLYYNLSNIHSTIYLAPGGSRLARWFNQFTGAQEFPGVRRATAGRVERATELARIVVKTTCKYLWVRRRVARFEKTVDDYAGSTHPSRLVGKTLPALLEDLRGFLDIRLRRWNNAALSDVAAMVCYGVLKHVLATNSAVADDFTLHGKLLSGLPGLISARPISELWKLSRAVRGDAALRQLFATASAAEIVSRLAAPEWSEFSGRFDEYLNEWGFRYSGELMLTAATPCENPLPIIRLLQSYCREDGPGPDEISAEQGRLREHASKAVCARFSPSPWLRRLPFSRAGRFRIILRATQGAILLRERSRMKQALLYTRLRHLMLRIGEEFLRSNLLVNRDDIFLLTVDEVLSVSDAEFSPALAPEMARATVLQRSQQQLRFATMQPPDSFMLARDEEWQPEALAGEPSQVLHESSLRGSCACGGQVESSAVVVLDLRDADQVHAGDILVTRQTDPGWATVFFLIKGLVIERGGMLSHGAIIAREYGIPAVVGVAQATQRIRSGDRLRVDGDHGVVEFCGR